MLLLLLLLFLLLYIVSCSILFYPTPHHLLWSDLFHLLTCLPACLLEIEGVGYLTSHYYAYASLDRPFSFFF